jgi:Holliday junction resolvase RusA-like endonuclease
MALGFVAHDPDVATLVLDGEWITFKGRGKKRVAKSRPWIHPSLNEWAQTAGIAGRYRVKAIKADWDGKIARAVLEQNIPEFKGPVKITVRYFIPADRDEDIDNRTPKFILDALVDAGVIEDDGRRIVRELRVQIHVDRENPRTEIKIGRWHEEFAGFRKMLAPPHPVG